MNSDKNQNTQREHPHTYLDKERLSSYIYQVEYASVCKPKNILYIGKGTGIAPYLLSRGPGAPEVITLDNDQELKPDILGSVLDIPLENKAVDLTMCCQVLEHLPFDEFLAALQEMCRVTRRRLILSLPDKRLYFSMRIKVPLIRLSLQLSLPRPDTMFRSCPKWKFKKSGHCWEIGYKGTSLGAVKKKIRQSGWIINEIKRVPDFSWHTFFDLYPLDTME